MNTKKSVNEFLSQKIIAVVGFSRKKSKFGNYIYKNLLQGNYEVYAINKTGDVIDGVQTYKDIKSLPVKVDGIVTVVPPSETENVVKEAVDNGIKNIWLQQGSNSLNAVKFCKENNINCVANECIIMFAEPVGLGHKIHRFIWKIFGRLPK